jgi:hypothetical protein
MAYPTVTRPTLILDGSSGLARSSGLDLVSGQTLYGSCWLRPTSTAASGRLILGYGLVPTMSFVLFHTINDNLFVLATANGSTITEIISPANSFVAGQWHFVEFQISTSTLSLAITPASAATVTAWTTVPFVGGVFAPSNSVPFQVGDSPSADGFIGQIASLLLLDRIPDITERISLFADGSGRRYWEMRSDTRQSIRSVWEFAGSAVDASPAGRLLDVVSGTPTYGSRSVTILSEHLLAGPLRRMADLVASSVAFQFAVQASSEAAARDRIHIEAEYETDTLPRPLGLVMLDQSSSSEVTRTVGSRVSLRLEAPQDGDQDTESSRLQFLHWAGTVIQQMIENSTLSGRPILRVASIEMALDISNAEETGLVRPCFATQVSFEIGAS